MNFEYWIVKFSYLAIFGLLCLNGFVSFPSSQVVMVVAGYFAMKGDLSLWVVVVLGGFAMSLGNFVLYEVARRKGVDYSLKFFSFLQVLEPRKQISKIEVAFRKRGCWFLFVGKLVNPIKIFIPIPAGIVRMNRLVFFGICFVTSTIWCLVFGLVGFYFGKSYENFGWIGGVMFLAFGVVCWYFYRYINSEEILKEISS